MKAQFLLIVVVLISFVATDRVAAQELASLKPNQKIGDFSVASLYSDADGRIVGAKFLHTLSHAPVFVIQIETAPQTFMWVDAPALSNRGLAHSLEHLLVRKGTKGRYLNLLRIMQFSQFGAASYEDYNFYCLTSGTGMTGFIEQFHAFLDALYNPDFTDIEAEREFYHVGIASDPTSMAKHLLEQGTVYNEVQTDQRDLDFYFGLNKQQFGRSNPFAFDIGGSPDEMRDVIAAEIQQFHDKHYRLGPGTGFIFMFSPRENVTRFLTLISPDFALLPRGVDPPPSPASSKQPKYAFTPSNDKAIELYPFPSANDSGRGEVRFGWNPVGVKSPVELRLLQLLLRALAGGERSLLYKSLIDTKSKTLNSGATSIDSQVFLGNSPWFPAASIELNSIPADRITTDTIAQLREHVLTTIKTVSMYSDDSPELLAFNRLVMSYAKTWQRDQRVWLKSAPLFSSEYKTDWKEHLDYLDTDPSFVRSLADVPVWQKVESQIEAGKNIWRDVILSFHLLETPYAAASTPSSRMLAKLELERKQRLQEKEKQLEATFGVGDEQQALDRYEQLELKKTAEIDALDAKIARPRFTGHPPLTPDDDIQYEKLRLNNVPVIAVLFDRAPTIDLGISFDLREIPEKYYKYLPILPRSFDSLGLRTQDGATSYSDLLAETQRDLSAFSIEYSSNAASRRADLAIRASTTSPQELQTALALISEMLQFSNVDSSNLDRLRDLVNERLADDENFWTTDSGWLRKLSNVFRYQDDPLYTALNSHFAQAHWDGRLLWLLHQPVSSSEIRSLGIFAEQFLASSEGVPANQLEMRLSQLNVTGLQKELVQYWLHNISSFPESDRLHGLQQLTTEVRQDLTVGPKRTIQELMELQRLVLNRNALRVDITVDPALLAEVRPMLTKFVGSITPASIGRQVLKTMDVPAPILQKIEKRVGAAGDDFPWYVGLEEPHSVNGGVVFSADFLGYAQLDRQSLITFLASKVASGTGPHTFFMKTIESGLAYSNSIGSDPGNRLLMYYADRVPDIGALVQFVNTIADSIPGFTDASQLDYTLQKAFPFPRSMSSFADRGKNFARDIYDGKEPGQIRRFSEAILKLRDDPGLNSEVTRAGLLSIGPVLLKPEFRDVQRSHRSIFFLVGPERLLADAEKRLGIPRLLRMFPCDFWRD